MRPGTRVWLATEYAIAGKDATSGVVVDEPAIPGAVVVADDDGHDVVDWLPATSDAPDGGMVAVCWGPAAAAWEYEEDLTDGTQLL